MTKTTTTMTITKSFLLVFAFCIMQFIIVSCDKKNKLNTIVSKIESPLPSLLQKNDVVTINNPYDTSFFKLSNGTILEVPSFAFIDKEGKLIKGKVSLRYKEYKDAVQILASGIPMEYDSAGSAQILQTAGMFEMYGFDSIGKAVFINPEKKIKVNMLSPVLEPDYNFYVFDTLNSNWKYMDRSVVSKESPVTEKNSFKLPNGPIAPQKYDPNGLVIDMKINYSDFTELASMKGMMWQYAGSLDNTKNIQQQLTKKWNTIKLNILDREKSIFELYLSNDKYSLKIPVVPVVSGKSYDRAMKDYTKKFQAYKLKYADELAKTENENINRQLIYRTVGIGTFGIYNHDRILNNKNPRITANFELENGEKLKNATVYHLYGGAATVIRYPDNKWGSFAFTKTGGNCLVVFMEDGKSAVFTNADFQKIDEKQIEKKGSYTFKMKSASSHSIDVDALRKMMNL